MKTVLLVGAGSTRAEAISQGCRIAQRPPLDADFFALAERHGLVEHRERVGRFLLNHFRIDLEKHPRPGMEEVFGLVYSSTLLSPTPPDAAAAFSSLCRIYAVVIAATTNWLTPSNRGPLCRLIRNLATNGQLSIITFNQDILIERALYQLTEGHFPIAWYPDDGYGLEFARFTRPTRSTTPRPLFYLAEDDEASSTVVIKPHGSLNWFAKTRAKDRVLSKLRPDQAIYCTRRHELQTDMTFTQKTKSGKGRTKWYTWPIIVPPIFEKGTYLNRTLEPVWLAAWDALSEADRLVVYGYSFPAADEQTRAFFRRLAGAWDSHPSLVTINPDFASATRANDLLSPPAHLHTSSVARLLSSAKGIVVG